MRLKKFINFVICYSCLLFSALYCSTLLADGPIANGNIATDTITPIGDIDTFTFSANAGDTLLIQVGKTSGTNFEPLIRLLDPNNILVDSNSGSIASDLSHVAVISGTYTVEVLDATAVPNGTGTYELFLAQVAAEFVVPAGDEGGSLTNGDIHPGNISLGDLDIWTFQANALDTVFIQIGEVTDGGGFDPELRLYDPFGNLVTSNWGSTAADLEVQLATAGQYTVIVKEATADVPSTGSYNLYFTNSAQNFNVPAGDQGGVLTNGDIHAGTIDLGDVDAWTFTADAMDTVLIQVGEVTDNGGFDPELSLYDSLGNLVASNWGSTAADLEVQLATAGKYTVIVKEATSDVPSTGSYNLYFTNSAQGFSVPVGDQGGPLTNGDIHAGTIDLGDVDAWTFTADAMDTVLIQIGEVTDNGGFDPELRLYDALGNLIASNWGSTAADLEVQLTTAGQYTVIVKEATADVPSTGSYNLYFTNTVQSITVPSGDEGGALTNGGVHPGTIDLGDVDTWTFTAGVNDTVLIQVGQVTDNGGFDPEIRLYDVNGNLIASNWGAIAADLTVQLSLTGQYTVVVKEATADVPATGSYNLYFSSTSESFIVPGGDEGGTLANGANEPGTIALADIDTWSFTVSTLDQIDLSITEVTDGGGFDPQVILYDPLGHEVARDSGTTGAAISTTATTGGTYTVVVREASADVSATGTYQLSYLRTDVSTNEPNGTVSAIQNGDLIAGEINGLGDIDRFSFAVSAGETVQVRLGDLSFSGSFSPGLEVFDASGNLLASSSGQAFADITFEAPSTQTVRLAVFNTLQVASTFNYELSLALASQAITTAVSDEGGALANGDLVTGSTRAGDLDQYEFSVNAGEMVQARMGDLAFSGNFNPAMQVLDSSGRILASATGSAFADLTFEAPSTETLRLVLSNTTQVAANFNYELSLAITSEVITTASGDESGTLANGDLVAGSMRAGDLDQYEFPVNAGEAVQVRIGDLAFSGNFNPGLRVLDSSGNVLAIASGGAFAGTTLTAPNTETLRLVVFNTTQVSAHYDYEVSLAITSQAITTASNDESGILANGDLIAGSMRAGDLDQYDLQVNAGETVQVRIGDLAFSGNFNPGLRVLDSSGGILASASGGAFAGTTFTAPNTETLRLVVFNTTQVSAHYDYEVSLAVASQAITTASNDESGLLDNGGILPGTIRAGDIDQYSLSVNAGDVVRLRLGDLSFSGNFNPALQVLDTNGQTIADSSGGGSTEVVFIAPNTETLRIVLFNTTQVSANYDYEISGTSAAQAFIVASGDEGGVLSNGVTVGGTITVGDIDTYVFSALSGELVNVLYEDLSPSGLFDPTIVVFDSTATRVAITPTAALQFEFTAPTSDVYYLVAFNGLNDSSAANNYNLTVSGITDNLDADADSLIDAKELMLGTDRSLQDTDADGLFDGDEVNTYGTEPLNADTDGDGIEDGDEIANGTDPLVPDAPNDEEIPFLPPLGYLILAAILGLIGSRNNILKR